MAEDSGTLRLDIVTEPVRRGLESAYGLFVSFGKKVQSVVSVAFSAFSDQLPLWLADLGTGLRAGFGELRNMETAITRVDALLRQTGGTAGVTREEIIDMANELQAATEYGDDVALSAQAILLQFRNIRGDVFKGVVQAAADLAATTGDSLSSAMDKLGRALNDPVRGLRLLRTEGVLFSKQEGMMIQQMVYAGDVMGAQEKILERVAGTFGGAAAAQVNTFSGRVTQVNNALGDMWRELTRALTPAFDLLLPIIQRGAEEMQVFAAWLHRWTQAAAQWAMDSWPIVEGFITQVSEAVQKLAKWVVDKMIYAWSIAETAIKNWEEASALAILGIRTAVAEVDVWLRQAWQDLTAWLTKKWDESWKDMAETTVKKVDDIIADLTRLNVGIEFNGEKIADFGFGGFRPFEEGKRKRQVLGADTPVSDEDLAELRASLGIKPGDKIDTSERDKLRDELAAAAEKFNALLQPNVDKNQAKFDKFFTDVFSLEAPGAASIGTPSDAPFVFDREKGNNAAGGFEDLFALQKRIASAAAKPPEVLAIEGQTQVIRANHRESLAALRAVQAAAGRQVEASERTTRAVEEMDTTPRAA